MYAIPTHAYTRWERYLLGSNCEPISARVVYHSVVEVPTHTPRADRSKLRERNATRRQQHDYRT